MRKLNFGVQGGAGQTFPARYIREGSTFYLKGRGYPAQEASKDKSGKKKVGLG